MDRYVEDASVDRFPKKEWRWDAPGSPGNTIGSSGAACENAHDVWNTPLDPACAAGIETVSKASTDTMSARCRPIALRRGLRSDG